MQPAILQCIVQRRAVKSFDPFEIPAALREQLLDAARYAPSSFNMQPYRFYWVESPEHRPKVAELCLGQHPAATASALVVAVADIGSLAFTSEAQVAWMRATGFPDAKIREYSLNAKIGRILFAPGPLGLFGGLKRVLFRTLNVFKTLGMPPLSRHDIFKWAIKGTSLACGNLMIAAEALDLNTCPMEGFDSRRLSEYLRLNPENQEIVMVIAVGKKCSSYTDPPRWRRPLESTVTVL
jgi:nitroreductase